MRIEMKKTLVLIMLYLLANIAYADEKTSVVIGDESDRTNLKVNGTVEISKSLTTDGIDLSGTKLNQVDEKIVGEHSGVEGYSIPSSQAVKNAILNNQVPVGTVMMYGGVLEESKHVKNIESQGWMICDGRYLKLAEYSELFDAISVTYGSSKVGWFKIPDCRGMFIRGVDSKDSDGNRSGNDMGFSSRSHPNNDHKRDVGTYQKQSVERHKHPTRTIYNHYRSFAGSSGNDKTLKTAKEYNGDGTFMHSTDYYGEGETRPKNIAFYYIIKAKRVFQ